MKNRSFLAKFIVANLSTMKSYHLVTIMVVFLFVLACNPIKKIAFTPNQPFEEDQENQHLSVSFNGTASFYIKFKNSAVLTDPFMSNPPMRKVMFGRLEPDTLLIQKLEPKSKDVKLIAVGHGHYDHILDLPYFTDKVGINTLLVGSENVVKQANALGPPYKIINVSPIKADLVSPGGWVYVPDSSMRVLGIKSEHLPHFCGIHLYKGSYKENHLEHFPHKGRSFKQDETLAYLIDYLNEQGKPVKRVYFSSSAVELPNGYFPIEILKEKEVDLAILSIALLQKVEHYPVGLVKFLKPKETILCHWEDFFRHRNKPLKPIALTDFNHIFESVDSLQRYTNVHFIKPGNEVVFP